METHLTDKHFFCSISARPSWTNNNCRLPPISKIWNAERYSSGDRFIHPTISILFGSIPAPPTPPPTRHHYEGDIARQRTSTTTTTNISITCIIIVSHYLRCKRPVLHSSHPRRRLLRFYFSYFSAHRPSPRYTREMVIWLGLGACQSHPWLSSCISYYYYW